METFEKIMSEVIKPFGTSPVFNCMLTVNNKRHGINFSCAKGITGITGKPISAMHRFRIGSITKLFTSTVILQLQEEGLLRLDDSYFKLINNDTKKLLSRLHVFEESDNSVKVSLFHLLTHQSGIRDFFTEERFLNYVMKHPLQLWNWKTVMEKYFEFGLNLKPVFVPGNGFHYSDTNYLLLAVLIEQITNKPLHQVYRERILNPLGLNNTYLEFYELPEQVKQVVYPFYGINSLENINTSFDWGCGGLISTMSDLDTFIRGLIKGNLFKNTNTLKLMLGHKPACSMPEDLIDMYEYTLGIEKKTFMGYSFAGHTSAYSSMLFYDSEKDISIILSLNQFMAAHKSGWLMKKILIEISK